MHEGDIPGLRSSRLEGGKLFPEARGLEGGNDPLKAFRGIGMPDRRLVAQEDLVIYKSG
jgi:hypothetical protein